LPDRLLALSRPSGRETIPTPRSKLAAPSPTIILPLLIVSAAFGVLVFQSYRLATRMEASLQSFAIEYLHSAAEIASLRVEAELTRRMNRVGADWNLLEREVDQPTYSHLEGWLERHPWLISAIYVPDADLLTSTFVASTTPTPPEQQLSAEFFTAHGSVRYNYDPLVLLEEATGAILDHTDDHTSNFPEAEDVRDRSTIELVGFSDGEPAGVTPEKYAVVVRLAPPFDHYGIRASVDDAFVGAGWQNSRVVSIWLGAFALVLLLIAGALVWRGIRKERETLELRSALIANVSHELRTPLSMIRMGVETLKRGRTALSDQQRTDIEDSMHRESMHLSHLVENVLDVARMEQGAARPVRVAVNPADLVESLVHDYRSWLENSGFTVELRLDENLEDQMWDREMLSRALLNLIDNAVKYSDGERAIIVSARDRADRIEISVTDRGVGLQANEIDRIFEPYYRARFSDTATKRGAGLGLTLVREIVRAHGGKMVVSSQPGKGSTFSMLLPKTSPGSHQAHIELTEGKLNAEPPGGPEARRER
jgi:signal transduction histidine kinase